MKTIKEYIPDILLVAVTIPWVLLLLLEQKYGVVAVYEPNVFILWGEVAAFVAIIGVGVRDIRHRVRAAKRAT